MILFRNFVKTPKDMIKGIIGAVIGDVAGSTREAKPVSSKRFKTFTSGSTVTDDTVLQMGSCGLSNPLPLMAEGVEVIDNLGN